MSEERWSEGKRRDGLRIVQGIDGLVILPSDDGLAVDRCPCCGKLLVTIRAARLVADMIYRIEVDPDAD